MRIQSLLIIQSSDKLIIHKLENISIPSLQGKIKAIIKKDSIQSVNTNIEIGSLKGDVKIQSKKKWTFGLGGITIGSVLTLLAFLFI